MTYFSDNYQNLRFPKASPENPGLRNAQIGAIHAIGQHFTLHDTEPALVVMPTGSGKTAVLTIAPFLLQARRVLVISSSKLVRGQITEKIGTLSTLKHVGAFTQDQEAPNIKEVKSKLSSMEDWGELANYDLVIGLPQSLSAGFEDGIILPEDLFDLILVDEAHHKPADTWSAIVEKFGSAKKVFFTATPFRRDKKEIKGKLVYSYPLSRAFRDGIFGEVGYYPVNADGLAQTEKDVLIAQKTEEIFQADRDAGLDHFIMVRTKLKNHADELAHIYENNTNLNLKVVHSSHTYGHIKSTIRKLERRELDGIICVNMLAEGFDFPNLKIGAIHEHHKSLAVTLQFIGRFARTNAPNIGSAKFIAAESDIAVGQNQLLYQDGSIWSEIIVNLSEQAIADIQENQELNQRFEDQLSDVESEFSELSLTAVSPYSHLKIFRTQEFDIDGEIDIPNQEMVYHRVSEEDNAIVIITKESFKPRWMRVDDLQNVNFFLYILHYDANRHLLYVHSSGEKSQSFYEDLIYFFGVNEYTIVHKEDLHKSLHGLRNINFFNIGLQNRAIQSGESYKIISGSAAHNGIKASDGRMYSNGHVQGTGETEDGNKITIGYSSGSKVWGSSYIDLRQFIVFCQFVGDKISSNVRVVTNTGLDSIPIPKIIDQLPENEKVYFIDWHTKTFDLNPFTLFTVDGQTIFDGRLLELDLVMDYDFHSNDEVRFNLVGDGFEIPFSYSFKDGYRCLHAKDHQLYVHTGDGVLEDFIRYLSDHPLSFSLTDLSTIVNGNELIEKNDKLPFSPDDNSVEVIDWDSYETDISKEYKNPTEGKRHIHDVLFEILADRNPQILIYDHGTGEIGDYIIINEMEREIHIEIFHVKAADTEETGDRVSYLYEVCGQAEKSLVWTKNRSTFLTKLNKRLEKGDNEVQINGNQDKVKIGTTEQIQAIFGPDKVLKFDIAIVQPGLSQNGLSEKLSHLLAATDDYIRSNANNERLRILCSEN